MKSTLATLARYSAGDTLYRVMVSKTIDDYPYPSSLCQYGTRPWKSSASTPKVGSNDFIMIMSILTNKINVEQFHVDKIERCPNTGQMLYWDGEEILPEVCLFDTRRAASVERDRIIAMFRRWTNNEL